MLNIKQTVLNVLSKYIHVEQGTFSDKEFMFMLEQNAKDLDSLVYISILIELEDAFGVELPEELLVENIFINLETAFAQFNNLLVGENSELYAIVADK